MRVERRAVAALAYIGTHSILLLLHKNAGYNLHTIALYTYIRILTTSPTVNKIDIFESIDLNVVGYTQLDN